MKKSLALFAAIAALISCSKVEGTITGKTVSVGVDAALSEITKAQFGAFTDDHYPLVWNAEGETALLVEFADGAKKEVAATSYVRISDKKASFGFVLPAKEASNYDYYMIAPFPGQNSGNGGRTGGDSNIPAGFNSVASYALPHATATQTPLADAPDPTTHIVLASDKGKTSQGGSLSMNFQSVVSYGKMKITGFPALESGETVSKIVITAPTGTLMRGRLFRDAEGSIVPFSSGAQSCFVNVDPKNITFNTTGFDVWFTTFPFALKAGDKLDVSVATNKGSYNASITLSKALEFKEGVVSSFTYNWTKGQPQPGGDKVLTFDFTGDPQEGWPTAAGWNGTSAKGSSRTCTYKISETESYDFKLQEPVFAAGCKIYWDSTNHYFAFGAQYRYLSIPLIEGYAISKAECTVAKAISTSAVAIMDHFFTTENEAKNAASDDVTAYCVAPQSWNVTAGTVRTYEIKATDPAKQYYIYCKSKGAAMSKLTLTYSPVEEKE